MDYAASEELHEKMSRLVAHILMIQLYEEPEAVRHFMYAFWRTVPILEEDPPNAFQYIRMGFADADEQIPD